ncbi:hypothetical protein [Micromonospora palythoicola]|uniref:hypothetical protein n=1 Tax=Micromonospora palythoicola TaxID=3120507 RepID=UPI002FCE3F2E
MVERGHQVVDRVFWRQCESLLDAQGELIAAYDAYRQLETRHRTEKAEAARRARWATAMDGGTMADEPEPDLFSGGEPERDDHRVDVKPEDVATAITTAGGLTEPTAWPWPTTVHQPTGTNTTDAQSRPHPRPHGRRCLRRPAGDRVATGFQSQ